jgi:divalent metal cation (Fe/Co/Zn/Cd) transporter
VSPCGHGFSIRSWQPQSAFEQVRTVPVSLVGMADRYPPPRGFEHLGDAGPVSSSEVDDRRLRRRARWLVLATIAWNVVESAVAITAGAIAGSAALVGFGLDAAVEVSAAVVALWYLAGVDEERERRALRLIALSFFALAAYVSVDAVRDLASDTEPERSIVGIALAMLSLMVMPVLARAKRRNGEALQNRTLIAEATQTKLCTYLSAILLAGLGLRATLGWTWADPIAALCIAVLAVREGREAWAGEECCGA